jgi:hypothetical protein
MIRRWGRINIGWRIAVVTILAAIVLPVAWYLGSPLFINVVVSERFPDSVSQAATPAGPIALSSGQFTEVDSIHKGEGTATVYRLPDNRQIIRFEPFNVQNGPDLYVYLSGHPMPRSSAQLHEQGTLEVARLKGNIGDQNYELPTDLDLSEYRAVVIYCKRFSQIFSTAELLPSQN